jgi:hypothetical protein
MKFYLIIITIAFLIANSLHAAELIRKWRELCGYQKLSVKNSDSKGFTSAELKKFKKELDLSFAQFEKIKKDRRAKRQEEQREARRLQSQWWSV